MKKLLKIVGLLLLAASAYAEFYTVNVKRVEQDLYKDTTSRAYIKTRFCYEYTYGEEAVLKYDRYSYDNKIIFESGTSCDVVKVFR